MDMFMTTLDPNKHYVFERVDNKVYAREVGTLNRFCIGEGSDPINIEEWRSILWFGLHNEILQDELNRVKVLYYLLKEDHPGIFYHPV